MAVKSLLKRAKSEEEKVQKFIAQGGSLTSGFETENTSENNDDHRLTLRIPKRLLDKVDAKRKQRIGTISRNLWILELIDKATQK
jgi:hypothetical protein